MWRSCTKCKYPIKTSLCMVAATFTLEGSECFLIKLRVCLFSVSLIQFVRTWQFSNADRRLKTKLTSLCFYSLNFGVFRVAFCFHLGWAGCGSVWFGLEGRMSFWGCALCQDVMLLGKLAVPIQHPTLKQYKYTWMSTVSRSIISSRLYLISSS